MKKASVFLAPGFEELEGLTVVDLLRRAGVEVTMVSIEETRSITGSHGITVEADRLFGEMDYADQDLLVLPGGMPGTLYLGEHEGVNRIIRKFAEAGKLVAAICAAPSVLGAAGILEGKKAVCHTGFEEKLVGAKVSFDNVMTDGNIITSRGMGTAFDFGLAIVKYFAYDDVVEDVKTHMIYK